MEKIGKELKDSEVVVQGFGNVGRYAALDCYERGAKVIAVNDLGGAVINKKGLNIPELFKHIAKTNTVKGFSGGDPYDEPILELECNVLIPAAIGGVITSDNAEKIKANAGGITASYFEWVQNTQNYLCKEKELHEKLIDVMITAFEEIWIISQKQNCDLRTAALIKGIKRVAAAKLTRGLFP